MTINCLIIDDEYSSQNVLKNFIAEVPFLEVIGICNNALEASSILNFQTKIDLLFLDINMPKISGLNFYKSLSNPPNVIFTTAYPQYAVDGFEVNAIDYLLKPFSLERFLNAVAKVAEKLKNETLNKEGIPHLIVKSNKVIHKVIIDTILYVEALGDYVKIQLENDHIVTHSTFTNILNLLPASQFIRTHKSFAINIRKLNSVSGNRISIGDYIVPIGQKYKAAFIKSLS